MPTNKKKKIQDMNKIYYKIQFYYENFQAYTKKETK